jgi:ubiquinone/menaquinone biosynthesis C-methylase UbiE
MSIDHSVHHFRPADDRERRKWQDPEAILNDIGLKSGMTFTDIGCGGGFFALPARMVGERGRVYGLDISSEAISALETEAKRERLYNIVTIVGDAAEAPVCRACCDVAFFGIDLHDFARPNRVLRETSEALKMNGKLVDLDWKKTGIPFGPPEEIRFSEEKASQIIEAAGFLLTAVRNAGPYHYIVEARLAPKGGPSPA